MIVFSMGTTLASSSLLGKSFKRHTYGTLQAPAHLEVASTLVDNQMTVIVGSGHGLMQKAHLFLVRVRKSVCVCVKVVGVL